MFRQRRVPSAVLLVATALVVLVIPSGASVGPDVYAAPGGGGDGSSATSPMSLAAALGSSSPAGPGSTVWLSSGTYAGCFTSVIRGSAASPVVVRPMPGARAVLDGATCTGDATLTISGSDSWFRDLEVTNSDPNRRTETTGSDPADYQRATGINVYGPRTKIINGWVHDNGNGIGLWSQALDSEVYGTVITRNGWSAPDRGHGHGIYTQNSTGVMRIGDVMSLSNYATGMKAFGYAGGAVGYRFDGVIAADNGVPAMASPTDPTRAWNLLVGTDRSPADNIEVSNGAFYQAPGTVGGNVAFGWAYPTNGSVTVTGNLIATGGQGLDVNNWQKVAVTGNTIYSTYAANPNANATLANAKTLAGATVTWDGNTYYDKTRAQATDPFTYNKTQSPQGGGLLSWTDWRANTGGWDASSSYERSAPPDRVVIRPNRYEKGRANVAIFNWSGQASTLVDLSRAGLSAGESYRLLDPYDLGRVVASGTYEGKPVAVATPTELTTYLVVPAGSAAAAPPATTTTTTAPPPSTTPSTTSTTSGPTTTAPPLTTTTVAPKPNPSASPSHGGSAWLEHRLGRFIDAVYVQLTGRPPSGTDRSYWYTRLTTGTPRATMIDAVLGGPGFSNRFVERQYESILRRAPRAEETASGARLFEADRRPDDLRSSLYGSAAYFSTRGGGTAAGFVQAVVVDVFGRVPTDAERSLWQSRIENGRSRAEVAAHLLATDEAIAAGVTRYAEELLRRPPNPADKPRWVDQWKASGELSLLSGLMASDAYFARVAE